MQSPHYFKSLCNPRLLAVLLLGFSSGLPLALVGATLQAWFTQAGVSLMTIGVLTLVGIPYVWKILWAPVIDRFVPPLLGRRRGWIGLAQLGLCIALYILADMNPSASAKAMGLLALLIAFLSATQDTAIDAYKTDVLAPEERGLGSAVFIFAYRMAMLISGGLALVLADHLGWSFTYKLMAVLVGISIIATYFAPEPAEGRTPKTFTAAIIEPFKNLFEREGIWIILLFVVFYKFGDAFALSLISNFLLHGLGFSLTQVGLAYKTMGMFATIAGAFVGGALLVRLNLYSALLLFGFAQAFSNLMFMLLAYAGKSYALMAFSIFIETFCSGMGTAAFMAFFMSLCDHRYSATQYALFAALSAVGRTFIGPIAALMVSHMGWINFYFWSFILSFPGIILLSLLRHRVKFNAELVEY